MEASKGSSFKRGVAAALLAMAGVSALAVSSSALAQSASQARNFNIGAQSLASALTAFGDQADVQVAADTALVQGLRSQGVSGTHFPAEALSRLLAGTGLTFRWTSVRSIVIERAPPAAEGTIQLGPVRVESDGTARMGVYVPPQAVIGNLPPEYSGGQVARGAQVGVLGSKDILDTPFNQSSFTAKLIQNQQASFLSDTLKNDPSVVISAPPSVGVEGFLVRGFPVGNQDILFNSMVGVSPTFANSAMTESIERIEVLKGPSALLNGMAPGGSVGGTINLVPKRAGDTPLTQITPSYSSRAQFGGHVDLGRRLGLGDAFGVRFNGVYRDGDTPIDHQSRQSRLATLGLDYRGERSRISADLGYQYQDVQGWRRFLSVGGPVVPEAPDSRSNVSNPWEFGKTIVYYGALRGEYDLADRVTVFAGVGGSERKARQFFATNGRITYAAGDIAPRFGVPIGAKNAQLSWDVGIRASFETGPISHQAVVGHTRFDRELRQALGPFVPLPVSNIYDPVYVARPNLASIPDPDTVGKIQDLDLTSTVIADTLSLWEERVQLTLGLRFQKIDQKSFNNATGALTGRYIEDATTPMIGLVYKPSSTVSVYGHYIEGLQQGETAPEEATNAGEIFPPYLTRQFEGGVKFDLGTIAATLAAYQVTSSTAFIDPATNIFGVVGRQRHRGVDLNVFGEVASSVRLLGGVSYIDSELTRTQGGTNDGQTGIGVPQWRLVAGAEWDTPFLVGLTLSGRATYNGSAYLNAENTLKAPDWTQVDIGARYQIRRSGDKPITIRASVDNLFAADYWVSDTDGFLTLSEPRTFKLSVSVDF